MKINPVICKKNQVQNFGRALTTEEKKSYLSLLRNAKKELNIQDTCAIVFDFNVPSETGSNTAIGTTWSESMKKFTAFLKDRFQIMKFPYHIFKVQYSALEKMKEMN